jgi:hypothetical protein
MGDFVPIKIEGQSIADWFRHHGVRLRPADIHTLQPGDRIIEVDNYYLTRYSTVLRHLPEEHRSYMLIPERIKVRTVFVGGFSSGWADEEERWPWSFEKEKDGHGVFRLPAELPANTQYSDSVKWAPGPLQTADILSRASAAVQEYGKENGLYMIKQDLKDAAINRRANALEFFYRSNPHHIPEGKVRPSKNAAAGGAAAGAGGKVGGGNRLKGTGRRRKTIRKRRHRRKSRKN